MDWKFINKRNEEELIEIVDVEIKLKKEEVKELLNKENYRFNFSIDKKIGDIIIMLEDEN